MIDYYLVQYKTRENPEAFVWMDEKGLHWLNPGQPMRQELYENHPEHDFEWLKSLGWTLLPNYSKLSWLNCAECQAISYDDYLCQTCRSQS